DKVITNVLISDNGACLMLGRNDEKFDMINAIVGNDENFIRWCNDFFNFKWTQGESFSRLRNQISV
ncbi:MAG: transcriptional regulator-like protein, partial [Candidatus Nitrosomaritimum yanchengensis]